MESRSHKDAIFANNHIFSTHNLSSTTSKRGFHFLKEWHKKFDKNRILQHHQGSVYNIYSLPSLEFCHLKKSYKCPRKSVHSMRLLFKLLFAGSDSGFYLRHQEQTFTKYPRKWRQNCLFMFPLKCKKRGEIQITIGTFPFLIGYLEFLSLINLIVYIFYRMSDQTQSVPMNGYLAHPGRLV